MRFINPKNRGVNKSHISLGIGLKLFYRKLFQLENLKKKKIKPCFLP